MKCLFVIGPSGSGKTTLSHHFTTIYNQVFGDSTATLINLDPANHSAENAVININELITVEDVMEQFQLGPNGAIIYAIDFLYENIDWLITKLVSIKNQCQANKQNTETTNQHLFVFDLPGQIQLYIHNNSLKTSIQRIIKETQSTNCILELFDCTYLQNIQHFVSLCMMSLTTMINFQFPHINLLNKIDLLKSSQTKINRGLINEYFNVPSMQQLVEELDYTMSESCKAANQQQKALQMLAKVIDTYGQVSFMPCSVYKANLVSNILYELQKIFGTLNESLLNKTFFQLVKDHDLFSQERAITELENQLGQEDDQQIHKFNADIPQ